jgi:hypothetical protein
MSSNPEFKFKLEISTKGVNTKHLLAVILLLIVLISPVIAYIVYLLYH